MAKIKIHKKRAKRRKGLIKAVKKNSLHNLVAEHIKFRKEVQRLLTYNKGEKDEKQT